MTDIPTVYWQALAISVIVCFSLILNEINRNKRP